MKLNRVIEDFLKLELNYATVNVTKKHFKFANIENCTELGILIKSISNLLLIATFTTFIMNIKCRTHRKLRTFFTTKEKKILY